MAIKLEVYFIKNLHESNVHQSLGTDDALADKVSAKKYNSAPPEYLEKRKQERERRRSETGFRQKFKKGARKSDTAIEVRFDGDISVSNFILLCLVS